MGRHGLVANDLCHEVHESRGDVQAAAHGVLIVLVVVGTEPRRHAAAKRGESLYSTAMAAALLSLPKSHGGGGRFRRRKTVEEERYEGGHDRRHVRLDQLRRLLVVGANRLEPPEVTSQTDVVHKRVRVFR